MKANKKTLMAVKQFLEHRDGWDLDELINEMVIETKLLNSKEINNLASDECIIEWDGETICVLAEFLDRYSEIFINKFCNILDSFVGEDISEYDFD
jgi:hypothetical protein